MSLLHIPASKQDKADLDRLAGTILFTGVTAVVLGAGIWILGRLLLALVPVYIAVPAICGLTAAPLALIVDITRLQQRGKA